jgi:hypothetical protein
VWGIDNNLQCKKDFLTEKNEMTRLAPEITFLQTIDI